MIDVTSMKIVVPEEAGQQKTVTGLSMQTLPEANDTTVFTYLPSLRNTVAKQRIVCFFQLLRQKHFSLNC